MKKLFIFTFVLMASFAFASEQLPEEILFHGKTYKLFSFPMEQYFKKNPDKRPQSNLQSSGLRRGYKAIYVIKNKQLHLKDILVLDGHKQWKSVMTSFSPSGKMLKLNWFSGILVLPYGKHLSKFEPYFGHAFTNYYLLEITKASFTGEKNVSYKQYKTLKEQQYALFRKTSDYTALLEKTSDAIIRDNIFKYLKGFLNWRLL